MIGACPTNGHKHQQVDDEKLFHVFVLIFFDEFATIIRKNYT